MDKRAAAACLALDPPLLEVAAFHCQQAAEKLLKAFLVSAQQRFRRTHDLEELSSQVTEQFPAVAALIEPVAAWTAWSIDYRYPGEDSRQPLSAAQVTEALAHIDKLSSALLVLAPGEQD
jgi:HEPN domain-containing protein